MALYSSYSTGEMRGLYGIIFIILHWGDERFVWEYHWGEERFV
jgi:hypothetical protein